MASTDFRANFFRYRPNLTALLVRIERALATINGAALLPPAADQLRSSALVGTIHYSTLIEGNELPEIEAERAARGELEPDSKAKIELVNYVDALDLLDKRLEKDSLELSADLILALHRETTKGLGSESSEHFKPHHEGTWRDGHAFVVDRRTETVMYEGPPAEEVPNRMESLCDWLRSKEQQREEYPPPVLAGVAHYAITEIHPFADGNGRVARLVAVAILLRHGFLPERLFSFERYYAENRDAYYEALRSVRKNTLNMEAWLGYFLTGLAEEYERVAAKVQSLSRLGLSDDGPLRLTPGQERALSKFALAGIKEFDRRTYEETAEVSKATANRELRGLVGPVLEKHGEGRSTRYRFRGTSPAVPTNAVGSGGRTRKWTAERIEQELRSFLAGRSSWPTIKEFQASGQWPLRTAMARNGGIEYWRSRFNDNDFQ